MHTLAQCIYSSVATPLFRDDGVEALLARARVANAQADVTGILLYIGRGIFQVLEGHPLRAEKVFAKIGPDPRHERVIKILSEAIVRRAFCQWTMGSPNLENQEVRAIPRTNDFFSSRSCLDGLESGRAKKLLTAFASGRWRRRIQDVAAVGSAAPIA
jgi:Sensors of blue-light using FAD